jgi:hypothetical protein
VNVAVVDISTGLRATAFLRQISRLLLPKTAEAMVAPGVVASVEDTEGGCGHQFRSMLLYIAAMVVSGVTPNPLGFFVAAAGYANAMYAYAECMEANKAQ